MKLLVILLVVGCASATLKDAFERESRDVINDFMAGIEEGMPLHEALGIEDSDEVRRFERDLKEELREHIKTAFNKALEQVEEAVKEGKVVNEKALDMLKDLHDKLKDLEITDEEIKDGIEHLKERVDEHLRNILTNMGIFGKRSAEFEQVHSVLGDLNLRNLLIKLKQMIMEKMDVTSMRESFAKIIGQGTQRLCEWITNKGKDKVLNFFDRFLEDDDTRKRATEDRIQEIKDYLEKIEEEVEKKLKLFKNWLKELIGTGLTKSEDGIQNVREIIKKIISQINIDLTKKDLTDALEFLQRYEKEFGRYYKDLRNIILEKLKKQE